MTADTLVEARVGSSSHLGGTAMTSKRLSQSALLCLIIATVGLPARTLGQPVAASDAAGKTGRFDLTLTERSPLSAAKEMATRFHVKPEELGADYDLSKLVFDVYVPPAPDEKGKYGLMVAVVFADGHGFAPEPQRPILDKYHMIWIGPTSEGEGKPIIERIGTCLDATQNAQKIWPIQQGRVYLSMNTNSKVVSGVGLFYPELFDGVLQSLGMTWFINIEDSHHKDLPEAFPRPPEKSFGVAKTRRFFFAVRDDARNRLRWTMPSISAVIRRRGSKHQDDQSAARRDGHLEQLRACVA